jgi:hypothetical protein
MYIDVFWLLESYLCKHYKEILIKIKSFYQIIIHFIVNIF